MQNPWMIGGELPPPPFPIAPRVVRDVTTEPVCLMEGRGYVYRLDVSNQSGERLALSLFDAPDGTDLATLHANRGSFGTHVIDVQPGQTEVVGEFYTRHAMVAQLSRWADHPDGDLPAGSCTVHVWNCPGLTALEVAKLRHMGLTAEDVATVRTGPPNESD